jgi:Tfp pilus assembly PilM family ATPase
MVCNLGRELMPFNLKLPFALPTLGRPRKGPSEIVGLDVATTALKVVRLKKTAEGVTVMSAAILPPLKLMGEGVGETALNLPKNLIANYTTLALTAETAVVRILGVPAAAGEPSEAQMREQAGLNEQYRIGYAPTVPHRGKGEVKMLAVGIPEEEVRAVLKLVAVGAPAPYSVEVAGLASLTAFLKGPGAQHAQDAVGVIESGARVTFLAVLNRNNLMLVRKFDFGAESIVAKVQQQLGVDHDTAQGIVSDGSFDISQPVHEVMDPFLRQLSISKDFVERREDCRVAKFYVSGGASLSHYWVEDISNAAGTEVERWNPFGSLRLAPDALPASLGGQETRFTAAVGGALGILDPP